MLVGELYIYIIGDQHKYVQLHLLSKSHYYIFSIIIFTSYLRNNTYTQLIKFFFYVNG